MRYLAHDEHPDYVWTSYYDPYGDMGVVSYVVLAARAAADAGLTREAAPLLEPALDFLGRVTDADTGRAAMMAEQPHCFDGYDSTAINAFCRRLLGASATEAPLSKTLDVLAGAELAWRPASALDHGHGLDQPLGAVVNHEFWYHATCAFAGLDTSDAVRYRDRVASLLVRHQRDAGRTRGSWDPIGVWARIGGRLYATCMALRTLAARRDGLRP